MPTWLVVVLAALIGYGVRRRRQQKKRKNEWDMALELLAEAGPKEGLFINLAEAEWFLRESWWYFLEAGRKDLIPSPQAGRAFIEQFNGTNAWLETMKRFSKRTIDERKGPGS